MSTAASKPITYLDDIESLMVEIDACLPHPKAVPDREHELQRQVYQERCSQARSLFERMAAHGARSGLLDGDAHRIRESLRRSLEFFQRLS